MPIVLDVVKGPHRGQRFTFDGHSNFVVGRAAFAHFRLPREDPYFSRVHFMIEFNPPLCRLVDMGSTNGTNVNGQTVTAVNLHHGDLIQGGQTVLKVSFTDNDVAGPAEPPEVEAEPPTPTEPSRPSLESTRTHLPLPQIDGYRLQRELGRGGMGVVYLAESLANQERVALKTIRPAVAGSDAEIQRFIREASILRQLQHPHIVSFRDIGQSEELLYFVMDYVEGTDASKLLGRDGPMEIGRAVRLICQALEALHYAHLRGFVHRDVKPANLLVSGEPGHELCKLADFGLARVYHASPLSGLTLLGDVGGTVPYMPPEQITDYRNAHPAADIYSAGATLYRLLTGHYLFDFDEVPQQQQLVKILSDEPVPVRARRQEVPEGLALAIHRGLDKDPSLRFPDALGFRDAILAFGGDD